MVLFGLYPIAGFVFAASAILYLLGYVFYLIFKNDK